MLNKWGSFKSIEDFEATNLEDGQFSVVIDEGLFENFFVKSEGEYLFVMLAGARNPQSSFLPYFNRWTWADKFPGSMLCVSDPTFNIAPDKLRLSWYIGTEKHDWMNSLSCLVESVSKKLGIDTSKIIIYGSSGGGFASIRLASELSDATAIAINPQIDIRKYHNKAVKNFIDLAFPSLSSSSLEQDSLDSRFSVFPGLFRARKAKCIILQNVQDKFHYDIHYKSFCDVFQVSYNGEESLNKLIITKTYDTPDGHGPEPKEIVPWLIETAVSLASVNCIRDDVYHLPTKLEIHREKQKAILYCEGEQLKIEVIGLENELKNTRYAYYVYIHKDSKLQVIHKEPYIDSKSFEYLPEERGQYVIKVFVKNSSDIYTVMSNSVVM